MKKTTLALAILFLEPLQAWARAGGAGGGSSSSGGSGGGFGDGGGGGGGGAIFDIIFLLLRAGPIGWIVLAVLAFIAYQVLNAQSGGGGGGAVTIPESHYSHAGTPLAAAGKSNLEQFASAFPGEDFNAFREKVTLAFFAIQKSWSEKNLAPMRRFITDGVYQRFHAQFLMMNLLEQSNPISDVRVHLVQVAKVSRDGAYDCVDLMIRASASDQFVCGKFPQLNTPGGNEPFTEFWTFVRRVDCSPGKDIFHSENCPQCAAPLTAKLMDTARCPYCGCHLNSGEFDWVLAEITQESDYGMGLPVKGLLTPADRGVPAIRELDPGFSVQLLEDKATNAFMEVLIGRASGQAALVKRFTTDAAYAELERTAPKTRFAFDRLFTKSVELLRSEIDGQRAHAFVGIRYSGHAVDLSAPRADFLGDEPPSAIQVLKLGRDYSGGEAKGSVYAGTCPQCGAPQRDNLNPLCDHCGSQLNDARLDWIVEAVLDPTQYRALEGEKAPA